MKLTYTKILSRKILLAFLALVIILAITALFVRNSISNKLESITNLAHNVGLDEAKPQHALLLVHEAEDDFQESLLNPNAATSQDYKTKLSQAFTEIDSILKEKPDTSGLTTVQHNKVRYWYHKKLDLSGRLYVLRHNFDSLLTIYADFEHTDLNSVPVVSTDHHIIKSKSINKTDTVKKIAAGKKKGLFGRLKDAISNKNGSQPQANVIEINHNRTNRIIDSTTRKIISSDKKAYNQKIEQLQQRNTQLLTTQKELVTLNIHISNELEQIINEEKEINENLQDEFNKMAFKSYHDTTELLNNFYLAALFLVLIFATLLIIFIIKLDKSEALLLDENERAVNIAKQKMDLLLHMSHEIRNPLTSIQGFLYIFGKTELTERQAEMVGSIKLSSDMLLRTLNDTLDAAKMESNEFKINSEPFNPDYILREVVESMEFSATKKSLELNYSFEGDKDAILMGDSFRLKQVMVNLLSNAIKYTKTGNITVNGRLDSNNKLYVDVVDTGEGISKEQQANLFSKYYQTNSAKGKLGTGLGLYICKELIVLQKGEISLKSEAGKGSVFSFNIPYTERKSIKESKLQTSNPLSLLNGIKILAVDDNELNLMFLKMMTSKWNVKFFMAANGNEALSILAKEDINVVLTDMQMPGMSGNELMAAIQKLKAPMNQLPVIIMSGEQTDKEKILKKGFAGFIAKPFSEVGLIKQIVAALKL